MIHCLRAESYVLNHLDSASLTVTGTATSQSLPIKGSHKTIITVIISSLVWTPAPQITRLVGHQFPFTLPVNSHMPTTYANSCTKQALSAKPSQDLAQLVLGENSISTTTRKLIVKVISWTCLDRHTVRYLISDGKIQNLCLLISLGNAPLRRI